jgi:hypothetical protein
MADRRQTAEELLADGAVTIEGATREFGVGRTKLYALMTSGDLPYTNQTGRRLIPRRALKLLLSRGMVGIEVLEPVA